MKQTKERVSFIDAFLNYWKKPFNLTSTATISEYWWGQLAMLTGLLAQYTILMGFYQSMIVSGIRVLGTIGTILICILMVWLLLSSLALFVRRMNDVGFKSTPILIWLLLVAVVLVFNNGNLIWLILNCVVYVIQVVLCIQKSDAFLNAKPGVIFRSKTTVSYNEDDDHRKES